MLQSILSENADKKKVENFNAKNMCMLHVIATVQLMPSVLSEIYLWSFLSRASHTALNPGLLLF